MMPVSHGRNRLQELPELSQHMTQIAEMVALGASNAAIADRLNLTVGTVKNYLTSIIYPHFDVQNRYELMRWWLENVEQRGNCRTCLLRAATHDYYQIDVPETPKV